MMGSSKSEDQKLWPSDGADHRLLSVALTLFDLTENILGGTGALTQPTRACSALQPGCNARLAVGSHSATAAAETHVHSPTIRRFLIPEALYSPGRSGLAPRPPPSRVP